MPDSKETPPPAPSSASRLKRWLVPAIILLLAVGIVFLITTNWNAWAGGRAVQETDDAYLHADLTPLSTKVAGLVATVAVSDYQAVKAGDLLVALRDDDFTAQVQQAEAAVTAAEAAIVNNQKQKLLQDSRIVEAEDGTRTADANIAAAEAGIEAANASIAGARYVLETLGDVYKYDVQARAGKLSRRERLEFHQQHSGPVMQQLHQWLEAQFALKQVEPNSGLGKAITYLLRHWKGLTAFLREAGAPLDNNVCTAARGSANIMPTAGLCRAVS